MLNEPNDLPSPLVVVLSFERLPLKLLSAYGSELGQTPVFDRLATRGVVCDQHFALDVAEHRTGHAWWEGRSQSRPIKMPSQSLSQICADHHVECHLISDCQPAGWDIAPSGWNQTFVEPESDTRPHDVTFRDLLETGLSLLTDVAQRNIPAVVWIHAAEMPEVPIPSMDFLEFYMNEFRLDGETPLEEEAGEKLEETEAELSEDERTIAFSMIEETLSLLESHAAELQPIHIKCLNLLAAARLSERDQQLNSFFKSLEPLIDAKQLLFLLTADQGLPLGEATITKQLEQERPSGPLQEERLHVPLLLVEGQRKLGERFNLLSCPADIPATILDWFDINESVPDGISILKQISGTSEFTHEHVISRANEWISIREPNWLFIQNSVEGIEQLYHKPEDRWQVLDVLSQNIEEADRLVAKLKRWSTS